MIKARIKEIFVDPGRGRGRNPWGGSSPPLIATRMGESARNRVQKLKCGLRFTDGYGLDTAWAQILTDL